MRTNVLYGVERLKFASAKSCFLEIDVEMNPFRWFV